MYCGKNLWAAPITGKKWEPKKEKVVLHDDETVETEWDDVLANATEEELVDLAGKSLCLSKPF